MTRGTKPDTPTEDNTPEPASPPPPAPAVDAPALADGATYEPYPGASFFHGGRNSPINQAMAYRLYQEGHWNTAQSPGPDWTNGHKRAFAAFQHTLRPKGGGDVSGIPDEVAWDQLHVPRVTSRPKGGS